MPSEYILPLEQKEGVTKEEINFQFSCYILKILHGNLKYSFNRIKVT